MIKIRITICCLMILLIGCSQKIENELYTVQQISDGDTITVIDSQNQSIKIRLACIDAPEIPHTNAEKTSTKPDDQNQFTWGIKTKQRLSNIIAKGSNQVYINIVDTDQYSRQVAEVRLQDQTLVQEKLIKEGLALVYRPYLKKCPSAEILSQAETSAKAKKRGIWSDSKFTVPWDFRRKGRS